VLSLQQRYLAKIRGVVGIEQVPRAILRKVAEALRSHPRRSERVSEVYSPPILKPVRRLVSSTSTSLGPTTSETSVRVLELALR